MMLDLLICTLPEEYSINKLKRLSNILNPQLAVTLGQVNTHIHDAGRSMPTGTKRNHLIKNTTADYFSFIDCDDTVPFYYVDEMMKAIRENPDVITFTGHMTTNGNHPREFTIKLGSGYVEDQGHYYRWPNHLCAFKRSVVEHIKFPDIWVQEDYLWSKKINDLRLLKSEVHINKHMYTYDFWDNKNPVKSRRR